MHRICLVGFEQEYSSSPDSKSTNMRSSWSNALAYLTVFNQQLIPFDQSIVHSTKVFITRTICCSFSGQLSQGPDEGIYGWWRGRWKSRFWSCRQVQNWRCPDAGLFSSYRSFLAAPSSLIFFHYEKSYWTLLLPYLKSLSTLTAKIVKRDQFH